MELDLERAVAIWNILRDVWWSLTFLQIKREILDRVLVILETEQSWDQDLIKVVKKAISDLIEYEASLESSRVVRNNILECSSAWNVSYIKPKSKKQNSLKWWSLVTQIAA